MTDLDFIPATYHATLTSRRTVRTQFGWGIGLIVAMVTWIWVHQVSSASASAELDQAHSQWGQLSESFRYMEELLTERELLEQRARVLDSLDDPASLVVVLAELSHLLPDGAVITQLMLDSVEGRHLSAIPQVVYQVPGVAPANTVKDSAADKNGRESDKNSRREWRPVRPKLHITGAAPTNVHISAFTAKLGGSPLFTDVNTDFVRDATFAGRQVRQFGVDCLILPQQGGEK